MFRKITFIPVLIVVLVGFLLRFHGLNWDEGYHFHPDERMLMIVAERINFFTRLDHDFFNYGSLPVYLLKGLSQITDSIFGSHIATYDGMLYVGRSMSIFVDLIVLIMIYRISLLLFKNGFMAFLSSFLYALAFFPIQNTHFFVVDVFLNLFITMLIYLIVKYLQNPNKKTAIFIGVFFAAAITTKVTAAIFIPLILTAIALPYFRNTKYLPRGQAGKIQNLLQIIPYGQIFIFIVTAVIFTFLFMPYAFLLYDRFISDIKVQIAMNSNAYIFPYTLQYVGSIPYVYYLKNIAVWGLGPFIFVLFLLGLYEQIVKVNIKTLTNNFLNSVIKNQKLTILIFFYAWYMWYFLFIGRSAVKFMRYMLQMYPFFVLVAGYGLGLASKNLRAIQKIIVISLIFLFIAVWTSAFIKIYNHRPTRILASEWINQNVPQGASIAVEHWDDRVPVNDRVPYQYVELTLYDRPDNEVKWSLLNEKLNRSDYIVIASNRLYVPLQKLDDCDKYEFCFPLTSKYYSDLFSGKLGFKKVAEFTSYPTFQIGPWKKEIIDDAADESFTVYDHPKIIIFEKV